MILANVIFGPNRHAPKDELEDAAERYLGSLYHTGQLCGEHFLAWTKGILNAHVILAGRDATKPRFHSRVGKRELRNVVNTFGRQPQWKMIDDEARRTPSTWKRSPFLYLFTHAFDWSSPICRGDAEDPVPLYLVPAPFEIKERIVRWQRSYRLHDNIWLDSGALEIAAYRQLADWDSELAEEGRSLCREIETATKVPTFYYLWRCWGRATREDERPCPECGGDWKVESPGTPGCFWQFDFKCDRCRLVSHKGVSTDGGRHARIGEFRGGRK
jgi:predicted  nucleic acid-binding Zn ribbon protein